MSQLLHQRLDAGLSSIGRILRDPLQVPEYQRSYSWDYPQVEAFWYDLLAAVVSRQPIYFLGTVVISTPQYGERAVVIDGQQRLATGTMLLAAIRDVYHHRGQTARADAFATRYLRAPSLATGEHEPQLRLNRRDHDFFYQYVIDGGSPEATTESHEKIKQAFDLISERLNDEAASAGPHWEEHLENWVEFVDGRAAVVSVRVDDDADAFLVFETLNDRGLDLTIADVVKNYLFGLCRNQIQFAEQAWISAQNSLEQYNVPDMTKFLRQWWSSQEGATRERELYARVREGVKSPESATKTLKGIEEAAPKYAATFSSDHPIWAEYPDAASRAIDTLVRFNLDQYRPLLIAAMDTLDRDDLARLMAGLVGWSVRGLVVGGIGGGKTERIYADAARYVALQKASSLSQIEDLLSPAIPSDNEFRTIFARRAMNRRAVAKYLLAALERASHGYSDAQLIEWEQYADRVVVQVIPGGATESEGWDRSFLDNGQVNISRNRLGNLVLVERREASRLPSDPEARLERLRRYLPRGPWDIDALNERQEEMADRAVMIWPAALSV